MKTKEEIDQALRNVNTEEPQYFGMSYEEGVREALQWVLGEVSDADFEYAGKGGE